MKTLLTSFLFISLFSFSQKDFQKIDLSNSGNNLTFDHLKQLDSIFEKSRLIGLGESTHGTSEFTTIRAEIFKYLIQNHDYSIFFLEADYNACSRVNRYIQGAEDDSVEALQEVLLWPWRTQELLDLVEWMKEYNLTHDNILEFVGCDMQLIRDDKEELPRLFSMYKAYKEFESKLPSFDFDKQDSAMVLSKQKEWAEFSNEFLTSFPDVEPLLIINVTQWFENAVLSRNKRNFRDSCMGNNIADYLERRPQKKGIYFAHNGHVAKISKQFEANIPVFKRAGCYLDERIGNQYFAIAMEFNTGSFNAYNFLGEKYTMETFTFKKRKRRSLAHIVLRKDDKIKYVNSKLIPSKKYVRITSIGAVHGKNKNGHKMYRFRKYEKELYDGVIVINKATPTHLLKWKEKKN